MHYTQNSTVLVTILHCLKSTLSRIWNVGTKTIQYHNSLQIQDFIGNCLGSNRAPVSACMPQVWQSGIENPSRYSDLCKPQYVPWATRTPPTHHYPFCPVTRVCISRKNQYGSEAIRNHLSLYCSVILSFLCKPIRAQSYTLGITIHCTWTDAPLKAAHFLINIESH